MKSPAFSFYVRDALCSNRILGMSGDAFKAYQTLIWQAWLQEPRATLPNDNEQLAILARVTPSTWSQVRDEVLPMFSRFDNQRIYSERLMQESVKQGNRSLAGTKNVNTRWKNTKLNIVGNTKSNTKGDTKNHTNA